MQNYRLFSSPKEVNEWIELNYTKDELEKLQVKKHLDSPLADYKGNAYSIMNEYIRHQWEDKQSDYDIIGLQNLLLSRVLCESIMVFRFVSVKELFLLFINTLFGKEYEYPAFLSTTLLKDYYAMDYIRKGRIAIKIYIPQGTKGTYIPEVNSELPEYEMLFPYRLKLKRISWNVYEIVGDSV